MIFRFNYDKTIEKPPKLLKYTIGDIKLNRFRKECELIVIDSDK